MQNYAVAVLIFELKLNGKRNKYAIETTNHTNYLENQFRDKVLLFFTLVQEDEK